MSEADIHFYFDPVCPFAWMTSKWVRLVQSQREYTVDWRFISLRQINAHVDYDTHFPPEYEAGHTAGLRLLRVLERTRQEHGREMVGTLYAALGARIFDSPPPTEQDRTENGFDVRGTEALVGPVLDQVGLPRTLLEALDDDGHDFTIRAETDEALALTGKDVGTPIIHFQPPEGTAFFGPVISRLPSDEDAVRLWDHVVGLAGFPGSPSSSAASVSFLSSAHSAWPTTRSASSRTGTAAAAGRRSRAAMHLDQARDFVGRNHRAVLATRTRDGGIQQSPVLVGVDADGMLIISSRETAYKTKNLRRDPWAQLCVFTDKFFGDWVIVEGVADILSLPEAMEPLVDYFRRLAGEHSNWDEYRDSLRRENRVLIRIEPRHAGPDRQG